MRAFAFSVFFFGVLFSLVGPCSVAMDSAGPKEMNGEISSDTKREIKSENKRVQKEAGVSGIVFFQTRKLKELREFYTTRVGATVWMDQGDCLILRKGNFLFGFCQRDKADLDALMTFFFDKKEKVDQAYEELKGIAMSPPVMHKKYPIYNFFARDPEGRMIEFQYFTGPIDWTF